MNNLPIWVTSEVTDITRKAIAFSVGREDLVTKEANKHVNSSDINRRTVETVLRTFRTESNYRKLGVALTRQFISQDPLKQTENSDLKIVGNGGQGYISNSQEPSLSVDTESLNISLPDFGDQNSISKAILCSSFKIYVEAKYNMNIDIDCQSSS